MKIFFLRHEERPLIDPTFYTELTDNGKTRASTVLKDKLLKQKFTHIYCSPFIRTLQTINPYVKEIDAKVNIENGFMEALQHYLFKFKTNLILPDNCHDKYNINLKYKSIYNINNCKFHESNDNIKERVTSTLKTIMKRHENTRDKILICTHKCICNIGLEYLLDINRDKEDFYPMGTLSTTIGKKVYFL